MNPRILPHDEQMLDLLALRAVEALNDADEAFVASWDDVNVFEDAAAVLAVGFSVHEGLDELPVSLRRGLERLGRDLMARRSDADGSVSIQPSGSASNGSSEEGPAPVGSIRPASLSGRSVQPTVSGSPVGGSAGWLSGLGWLAAAACLALAVVGWSIPRGDPGAGSPQSAEAMLAALEARPGVIRTSWLGVDNAGFSDAAHPYDENLSGEVIWDPATNEGYMVFEGLADNDPARFQYQLWIFDETRPTGDLPHFGEGILSQRPVPGAVFDVTGDGRVVVPVQAKLPVGKAVIFAITVEPPGGVVVSARDIVTLAMVK